MSVDDTEYGPREYLFYKLLSRIEEEGDLHSLYKTRLWKLACETDHYLVDDLDVDIGFPRFWYQYGEVPKVDELRADFYSTIKEEDYRRVELDQRIEHGAFVISDEVRREIDRAVDWIIEKFLDTDTYDIKDYHYEQRAPNEFIRIFDNFRDQLIDADFDQQRLREFLSTDSTKETTQEQLLNKLDQLVQTYPEQYDSMDVAFMKWEDTMRLLIEQERKEEAIDLLELFWRSLSKAELRIHHNHGVDQRQVEAWRQAQSEICGEFRDALSEYREPALKDQEIKSQLTDPDVQAEYLRSLDLPVPETSS